MHNDHGPGQLRILLVDGTPIRAEGWCVRDTLLLVCEDRLRLAVLQQRTVQTHKQAWVQNNGGLWIEGCRLPSGRFPTNLMLIHTRDCVYTGLREVPNPNGSLKDAGPRTRYECYGVDARRRGDWTPYGVNGMELVPSWRCSDRCLCQTWQDDPNVRYYPQFASLADALVWLQQLLTGPVEAASSDFKHLHDEKKLGG